MRKLSWKEQLIADTEARLKREETVTEFQVGDKVSVVGTIKSGSNGEYWNVVLPSNRVDSLHETDLTFVERPKKNPKLGTVFRLDIGRHGYRKYVYIGGSQYISVSTLQILSELPEGAEEV